MSPAAAPAASRPGSSGVERIVAVALAAMLAVLLWVWIELRRSARTEAMALDFTNPLLSAEPGECVEVENRGDPGNVGRLVVIAPAEGAARGRGAAVIRPREGPESIPGYAQPGLADLRTSAPYLACEVQAGGPTPPGAPAGKREVILYDLNGFGFARGTKLALREILPARLKWQGKPLRCHEVVVQRYDRLEGTWRLFLARDAHALGTVLRRYYSDPSRPADEQSFHPCR